MTEPTSTRYQAVIEIDVSNAGSESEARQAIFKSLSSQQATTGKRGRPSGSASVTASVTGIRIYSPQSESLYRGEIDADYALKLSGGEADVVE